MFILNWLANCYIRLASLLPSPWLSLLEASCVRADDNSRTNCSSSIIYFFYASFSTSSDTIRVDICFYSWLFYSFSSISWLQYSSSYLFCSFSILSCSVNDYFWCGWTDDLLAWLIDCCDWFNARFPLLSIYTDYRWLSFAGIGLSLSFFEAWMFLIVYSYSAPGAWAWYCYWPITGWFLANAWELPPCAYLKLNGFLLVPIFGGLSP